jgi:hypothetical protein
MVAAALRTRTWVLSAESSDSNTNAPGIAGNDRSSVTYTRTANRSSDRRLTRRF